jgi:hypothetical protein
MTMALIDDLKGDELFKVCPVFVFIDGLPEGKFDADHNSLLEFLENFQKLNKNVKLIKRNFNLGLRANIIDGVSSILKTFPYVVVLEDDLRIKSGFLEYMNESLIFYSEQKMIGSITGYSPDVGLLKSDPCSVYLSPRHSSWGWGTWKKIWDSVDWSDVDYQYEVSKTTKKNFFNEGGWDLAPMLKLQSKGKINSWSIQFDFHCWQRNLYCVTSFDNYIHHTGIDNKATHFSNLDKYNLISGYSGTHDQGLPIKAEINLQPLNVEKKTFKLVRSYYNKRYLLIVLLSIVRRIVIFFGRANAKKA